MVKKLAIDWDESELRLVAAQCSGRSVKVTDAAVVPLGDTSVGETLRMVIQSRGLENTDALVAIGRGKAELRELQLPPVPDDELPDMVRFQAIRSFASAGDSATVDYLVTNRTENGVEMIAAAIGPTNLNEIREICEGADLTTRRVSLRPLAASALFLIHNQPSQGKDTVLIDLLADDAEIVVAREGRVIFVRTVRMPSGEAARGKALAGELRRSLVACGSSGSLDRVVLWGRESVHAGDLKMLAEASGSRVEMLNPFDLVDVDRKTKDELPEHVGRLAPLVGLLAADESDADRLVDFLNPRERVEETPSPYRTVLLVGVPIAAVLLMTFAVYSQLKGLDQQIADLQAANTELKPSVDQASQAVARTEKIDVFLDGDVNWLSEIRRLAKDIPPSDKLIVRGISATSDPRSGGGTLKVEGAATDPAVIDQFEEALRDASHQVSGDGASEQKTSDAYRWGFTESIKINPAAIRNERYAALTAPPTGDAGSTSDSAPEGDAAPAGDAARGGDAGGTDELKPDDNGEDTRGDSSETPLDPESAEAPPPNEDSPPENSQSPSEDSGDQPSEGGSGGEESGDEESGDEDTPATQIEVAA